MPVLGKTKKDVVQEFRTSEILDAARAVFASEGFADATVDDIADRAGVAKGTVYVYFPSKRDLFLAALRQGIVELHSQVRREIEAAPNVEEKLRAFLRARLSYCARNRDFFRIYYTEFATMHTRPSPARLDCQDLYDQQSQLLESILQEGVEAGALRPMDVARTARLIYELARAAVAQHVMEWPDQEAEDTTNLVLEMVLKGIGCD
jgi:AcrR family transcriptional regulator